jgi:hypothetical protein
MCCSGGIPLSFTVIRIENGFAFDVNLTQVETLLMVMI